MAKNALFLATSLMIAVNTTVMAQELPQNLFSYETKAFQASTNKGLSTFLIPAQSQERWNLVYQQTAHTPVVSSIQFHPELHVFVAHSDATLSTVMKTNQPSVETAPASTPSATTGSVTGDATPKSVNSGSVITISKTEQVAATPKPTPTPTVKPAAPLQPSDLDALFAQYGSEYGVSPEVLKRIAQCESGLRPEALSGNGLYGGLFQFVSSTWSSNRRAMGLDPNPALRFNAAEAIKTGAFKISRDGVGAWPVCGKRALAASGVASL